MTHFLRDLLRQPAETANSILYAERSTVYCTRTYVINGFGKGMALAVPPGANKHAGFSPCGPWQFAWFSSLGDGR
jgi:hypothetical protein